mgnify:CR=1 FL=1
MPLQYPLSSHYNPYVEPKKPVNLPKIILIIFCVIVLIVIIYFFVIRNLYSEPKYYIDKELSDELKDLFNADLVCGSDVYNCANFTIQTQAQQVYDYCKAQGQDDIHGLDKDGNGKACENLE